LAGVLGFRVVKITQTAQGTDRETVTIFPDREDAEEFAKSRRQQHKAQPGSLVRYEIEASAVVPEPLVVGSDLKTINENKLFETLVTSAPEAREARIEILNELLSRRQFQDVMAAFASIIASAKKWGMSSPEGSMLSDLLNRVMRRSEGYFEVFLSNFVADDKNRYFVGFAARIIKNLSAERKMKAIPSLAQVLFQQDSWNDLPAELITDALTTMQDEKLDGQAVSEILPTTSGPNAMRVLLATRVLSKIAGKNALKGMLTVLDRTLADWYAGLNDQIQDQVILYLTRSPSEEALPRIRKLIPLKRTGALMLMFHGFQFRSAAELLEEFIEQNTRDPLKRDVAEWCVMALAQIEPRFIDLPKLVSNDALFQRYWQSKYYIKMIFQNAKEEVKPMLFELLKGSNFDKYTFAAECLSEWGVSLDEMSTIVGESPSHEIYRFFYPKETAEEIWQKGEVKSLGGPIGRPAQRFDLFLVQVLTSFNLQVLYVDSANKPGVDIVALSPSGNHMIIAGATVDSLKDDLGKLIVTFEEMRDKMKQLMDRHDLLPIIFSASKKPITDIESESARKAGIVVLGRKEVESILKMSRTGRTSDDLIRFLKDKQQELSSLPIPRPW
jgi:hypothetical protein